MHSRDYRDIIGGSVLALIGLFAALNAGMNYELGTIMRMGPGMFPMGLGVILLAFGILIIIPALSRAGELPDVDYRQAVWILGSILVFAVTIRPIGLVPAILLQTVMCRQAEDDSHRLNWWQTGVLAASLALLAVLVFPIGLGVPLNLFAWPF